MSFEIYERKRGHVLPRGKCRVSPNGGTALHAEDLQAAQVTERATILVDAGLRCIALRAPRDGEPSASLTRANKSGSRRKIALAGALLHMGITAQAVRGVHDVVVKKDGLLLITFGPTTVVRFGPTIVARKNRRETK